MSENVPTVTASSPIRQHSVSHLDRSTNGGQMFRRLQPRLTALRVEMGVCAEKRLKCRCLQPDNDTFQLLSKHGVSPCSAKFGKDLEIIITVE